jgi:hypothetical protein
MLVNFIGYRKIMAANLREFSKFSNLKKENMKKNGVLKLAAKIVMKHPVAEIFLSYFFLPEGSFNQMSVAAFDEWMDERTD